MSAVELGCRLMLAVVFVLAAQSKVRGRKALADFTQTLGQFGFPRSWSGPLAITFIIAELACALLLLVAAAAGYGLALALLGGFTLGIARVLRGGAKVRCRCFGASDTPMGAAHLVRNGLLLSVALLGAVGHGLGAREPLPVGVGVIAGAVGLLAGFFVTRWDDLVFLLRGPVPNAGLPVASRKQRG